MFTTHGFTIPVSSGKPVHIVFFGDVHRDSPSHAEAKWQKDLEYMRGLKDAYFIGMGDYHDSASTTEREMLGHISEKMHSTFKKDIEELKRAKVKHFAKEIQFMGPRLIGLLNGNHYYDMRSGINSDQLLCESLDTKYLGCCSFIRLSFNCHSRVTTRDIFAHHGLGAARLIGGSINRVAQMLEGAEADIVVMGHDHRRAAVPGTPRLYLAQSAKREAPRLCQRETWVIRSGSYLKSYEPEEVNYNVDAQRPPVSLGLVELICTLTHFGDGRSDELEIKALV